jgi:hypothetical protein
LCVCGFGHRQDESIEVNRFFHVVLLCRLDIMPISLIRWTGRIKQSPWLVGTKSPLVMNQGAFPRGVIRRATITKAFGQLIKHW